MTSLSARQSRISLVLMLGWIAAALAGVMLAENLVRQADRTVTDFHSYFTAGHLVVEGKPIANFYDDAWFNNEANRFAPNFREIYSANLPTTALVYVPLAVFETHAAARRAWTILSIPLLVLFVEGLIGIASASFVARPYWYAVVLFSQPVAANFIQGQAYLVIGLGLIGILRRWQKGDAAGAGTFLAGLFAYKSAGTMLWPLALATGRWRLLLWAAGTLALVVVATWPFVGLDGWSAYLNALNELSQSPSTRATAFQSIPGFVQHVLSGGGDLGQPIIQLSAVTARAITIAVLLMLLGATMYVAHQHPGDDLVVGAGVMLTLVVVPVTLVHAYTIACVPIAQLVRRLRGWPLGWNTLALWAGAAMIIVPSPFRSPRLFDGWAAIMAYPKLYGGLVLWLLCIFVMLQARTRPTAQRPAATE